MQTLLGFRHMEGMCDENLKVSAWEVTKIQASQQERIEHTLDLLRCVPALLQF